MTTYRWILLIGSWSFVVLGTVYCLLKIWRNPEP